jgi:adenylate kinase
MDLGYLACVFGQSGVGKSFLIRRFIVTAPTWAELRASALLTDATGQNADQLRKNDRHAIEQNQYSLVEAVRAARASSQKNYLLDGHLVIDNDKELVAVPMDVIAALAPDLILFVYDDPESIVRKVASDPHRARAIRSVSEIRGAQDFAARVCEQYSRTLQIDCRRVRAGDEDTFAAAIHGAFDQQPVSRAKI